jgi:hypothetical protein
LLFSFFLPCLFFSLVQFDQTDHGTHTLQVPIQKLSDIDEIAIDEAKLAPSFAVLARNIPPGTIEENLFKVIELTHDTSVSSSLFFLSSSFFLTDSFQQRNFNSWKRGHDRLS